MPTRRQFITSCTALAVTASMQPAIALSAPPGLRQVPLEEISFMDFAANLNSPFLILAESRAMAELQLVAANAARPLPARAFAITDSGDARNEKFSLLFVGEASAALPAAIHDFEHERIGRFQMFVSPVGPAEPGLCYYEAVFNRPAASGYRDTVSDVRRFRR